MLKCCKKGNRCSLTQHSLLLVEESCCPHSAVLSRPLIDEHMHYVEWSSGKPVSSNHVPVNMKSNMYACPSPLLL
jgi:hypothetical protein